VRRRIWRWLFGLIAVAALACGLRAIWLEPASLTISEERINLRWSAPRPLRIAVLTDLHVGSPFNGLPKLRRIVARTNDARPDVICLLGDLVIQGVTGGRFVEPETIAAELKNLRSPGGVVAVLGNHDGWLNHDRVQRALEANGIRIVEDRAARIDTAAGPIWFAGVSDLWTGRHDIGAALAGVKDDGAPVILLTHNPDVFPDVPARVTLTLAGHTHGGQVRLPFVGRPIVPSQFGQRYAAGHIVEGGRHLFVATGLGTSILPVRFRVPPAVAVLTLTDESPEALPRADR
jgi:hypothetical protein